MYSSVEPILKETKGASVKIEVVRNSKTCGVRSRRWRGISHQGITSPWKVVGGKLQSFLKKKKHILYYYEWDKHNDKALLPHYVLIS